MILLFITPYGESQPVYFDCVPARAFIHCALFWGFVHIWLGTCKKQLKYESLKRKAFSIVFLAALIFALLSELGMYLFGIAPSINLWNLAFDLLGAGLGLLTFRILYASCY
jgi:hypothetical protein